MCFSFQQKLEEWVILNRKLLSADTILWAISAADNIFDDTFLIFPANRIWHFMQTIYIGDN